MIENSDLDQVLEENEHHVKTPEGRPNRGTQGEAAAAKSSPDPWMVGYLKGLANAAKKVGSAGLGDKGAEIITRIADHIVMCGGLTDDDRAHEYAFWHVEGLEASEAEQEAARKIYERPDGKPVAYAEIFAKLRRRKVGKAEQTQRRHSAKRRATSHKGEPTLFGKNVLRFCEYLGITPEDLSLAMGLHRSRIEKYCYGRDKATTAMKDQVKSLLIEAVSHPPDDQPLTVEWLRDWYGLTIKHEPPKRYKWMAPHRYEPPGPNHP